MILHVQNVSFLNEKVQIGLYFDQCLTVCDFIVDTFIIVVKSKYRALFRLVLYVAVSNNVRLLTPALK